MSTAAQAPQLGAVLQPDDNLLPGQSYTYTFKLENWFSLPSETAVAQEIANGAPDFIGNVQVKQLSGLSPFTNYFDVTFTYHGDGSDVASDVAQELISAFSAGGDSFSLSAMNMGNVGLSAATDLTAVTGAVANTAGQTIGNTLNQALSGLGTTWTVIIFLGVAAVILFELGGVSGIKQRVS